jgi:hypothetical protein
LQIKIQSKAVSPPPFLPHVGKETALVIANTPPPVGVVLNDPTTLPGAESGTESLLAFFPIVIAPVPASLLFFPPFGTVLFFLDGGAPSFG